MAATLGQVAGAVKFYNRRDKFGFIDGDDGVQRFFNSNELRARAVAAGERVTFIPCANERGPFARRITLESVVATDLK